MSCPSGHVSHSAGTWKPADAFLGVVAVVQQLSHLQSSLHVHVANFEHAAEQRCKQLSTHSRRVHCISPPLKALDGYGMVKIVALQATLDAVLDEAVWLDCDAFPVSDPAALFTDAGYLRTGAIFWPDIEGRSNFPPRAPSAASMRRRAEQLRAVFDGVHAPSSWQMRHGFDTGVIVLQGRKTAAARRTLLRRWRGWSSLSFGDKDLWHIAWLVANVSFAYMPHVGCAGSFGNRRWNMASQLKFNAAGDVVVLHQLWRDRPQAGTNFNRPQVMLRVDLRAHANYSYQRSHDGTGNDRAIMSSSLSADEMFPTPQHVRDGVGRMAALWGFDVEPAGAGGSFKAADLSSQVTKVWGLWSDEAPAGKYACNHGCEMRLNPDADREVVNRTAVDRLFQQLGDDELRRLYDRAPVPVMRSDIVRIAALTLRGGWYADLDVQPRRPWRELNRASAVFFTEQENKSRWACGPKEDRRFAQRIAFEVFFVDRPRHPFLAHVVRVLKERAKRRARTRERSTFESAWSECDIFYFTGPDMFTAAYHGWALSGRGPNRGSVHRYTEQETNDLIDLGKVGAYGDERHSAAAGMRHACAPCHADTVARRRAGTHAVIAMLVLLLTVLAHRQCTHGRGLYASVRSGG